MKPNTGLNSKEIINLSKILSLLFILNNYVFCGIDPGGTGLDKRSNFKENFLKGDMNKMLNLKRSTDIHKLRFQQQEFEKARTLETPEIKEGLFSMTNDNYKKAQIESRNVDGFDKKFVVSSRPLESGRDGPSYNTDNQKNSEKQYYYPQDGSFKNEVTYKSNNDRPRNMENGNFSQMNNVDYYSNRGPMVMGQNSQIYEKPIIHSMNSFLPTHQISHNIGEVNKFNQVCPCSVNFKCPPCGIIPPPPVPRCGCAPKLTCPRCPAMSMIHEIASRKAIQDQKLASDLKNISSNMTQIFKLIGKYAGDVLKYELEAKDASLKMEEAGIKAFISRQQMEKTSEKARMIARNTISPRCIDCQKDPEMNNFFLMDKVFPEEVENVQDQDTNIGTASSYNFNPDKFYDLNKLDNKALGKITIEPLSDDNIRSSSYSSNDMNKGNNNMMINNNIQDNGNRNFANNFNNSATMNNNYNGMPGNNNSNNSNDGNNMSTTNNFQQQQMPPQMQQNMQQNMPNQGQNQQQMQPQMQPQNQGQPMQQPNQGQIPQQEVQGQPAIQPIPNQQNKRR